MVDVLQQGHQSHAKKHKEVRLKNKQHPGTENLTKQLIHNDISLRSFMHAYGTHVAQQAKQHNATYERPVTVFIAKVASKEVNEKGEKITRKSQYSVVVLPR